MESGGHVIISNTRAELRGAKSGVCARACFTQTHCISFCGQRAGLETTRSCRGGGARSVASPVAVRRDTSYVRVALYRYCTVPQGASAVFLRWLTVRYITQPIDHPLIRASPREPLLPPPSPSSSSAAAISQCDTRNCHSSCASARASAAVVQPNVLIGSREQRANQIASASQRVFFFLFLFPFLSLQMRCPRLSGIRGVPT